MDALSRREFLSSMGTIAAGGLAGMSIKEAMAQPIEKLAENIPTRILGPTGFKTKILGFGTMLFGNDTQKIDNLLNTAVDLGINVFETGRTYGIAEASLSKIIAKHRDKIYISSKSHKRDKKGVMRDIEVSLAAFKTDHIDQYGHHDISSYVEYERTTEEDGALAALEEAKKQGKIRFFGMSSHNTTATMAGLRSGNFAVFVMPYNPCHREFERCLNLAAKMGVGVQLMKSLGGYQGNVLFPDPKDRRQVQEGLTVQEVCRFCLSHPAVTHQIIGFRSVEDLKQDLAIVATFKPLNEKEHRDIIAKADRINGGMCGLCEEKPCEKVCPNQVPISFLVSGLQYVSKFEWDSLRKSDEYEVMLHDYLDCDSCGECEKVCPQKFEVRKDMAAAHQRIIEQRIRRALRKYGTYYLSWDDFKAGKPADLKY